MNKERGITLVALVITIIILLILATISIVALNNTKLFDRTIEARDKYQNSVNEENDVLDNYANTINYWINQ